jgi:membrane-bound serine protease (ClpP class)
MWKLPGTLLAMLAAGALILAWMLGRSGASHRRAVTTGAEGMLGLKGRALTGIAQEGRVEIQGELWQARARTRIAAGERIRVIGLDGLTLEVEPASDAALPPRQVSAVAPPEESDNS